VLLLLHCQACVKLTKWASKGALSHATIRAQMAFVGADQVCDATAWSSGSISVPNDELAKLLYIS
jgi:hypothetical protein